MKRYLFLLGAVTMCAATTASWAAPLSRKDVAAEPALLASVDVDALRETSVGKTILAEPDVQTKLAAVQAMFNFDFRTQLHGFTIYSTMDHSQDPVGIIYADFEADRLITLAKAFPGFQSATNGGHVIYNWVDEKKKGAEGTPRIYAAIAGKRLVFGKTESVLLAALDVLEGKSPTFSGGKFLLEKAPGDLVVAEGAVLKFEIKDNDPSAAIFQASKAVRFQLSEKGDKVGATVSFEAKDADTANSIFAMVNGLLALVRFQKDNPDILKLANAISIKQDGTTVLLGLAAPSADIVQLIKKGAEENERKEAQQRADDSNSTTNKTQ